jgi:lipopolysaccharide export system protein LptA
LGFSGKVALAVIKQVDIEAEGNVDFNINTKITVANKNVKLTSENGLIEADRVTYDGNTGLANATGGIKLTKNEVVIVADRLDYDNNLDLAKFYSNVKLTSKNGVIIEAAELSYDGNSGLVVASGGVKITQGQSIYQTDAINYNLNDQKGTSSSVKMQVDGVGRPYKVTGNGTEITKDSTTISNATITRCIEPHPEYVIKATTVTYSGQYIKLRNAVLYVEGVPIFYYPVLSLRVDGKFMPGLQLSFNPTDGFLLSYNYATPIENGQNWTVSGLLKTKTTSATPSPEITANPSTIGIGYGSYVGNLSNHLNLSGNVYSDASSFSIADTMTYNMPLFYLVVDGSRELSSTESTQYGFSLTRKYWNSPIGNWQFGILARDVSVLAGSTRYSGIYGGYRLDYNPNPYMTFSLLQLQSLAGENYQGYFLSDYQIGSNWFYNMSTPIMGKYYSLNVHGTYNSDLTQPWIHRIYNVTRETDCIAISLGWDDVPKSLVFNLGLHF